MPIVRGSPFKVDWTNKNAVIDYAERLGKGMTVFRWTEGKYQGSYGITHTERRDRWDMPCKVVIHQT